MQKLIGLLFLVGLLVGCQKNEQEQVLVTGISLEQRMTLTEGKTEQYSITLLPENASQQVTFVWSSSDPAVATVDASRGTVTALKKGETLLTVKLAENASIQATCLLTVVGVDEADPNEVVAFEDPMFEALMMMFDQNNDGVLQRSEAEQVTEINVCASQIASLKGIEYCTALETLDCSRNELTTLDVSRNTALKTLICDRNRIESLDMTWLKELQVLNCRNNRLSTMDVSQNPELISFKCGMNQGNGYDHLGITQVDVTHNKKLEVMDAYYLNLTALDVTQNPKLKWLDFAYCAHTLWNRQPITRIDLTHNPELEYLNCMGSVYPGRGLQSLDVSKNPKLKTLICLGNNIPVVDVSRNPELTHLSCSRNPIKALDVTRCPKIDTLSCEWNNLTRLDLTQSTALVYLNCANNEIDGLDLSHTRMGYLLANNNRMTYIVLGETHDTPGGNDNQPYFYMKLNNNLLPSIDLSKQRYLKWLEVADNRLGALDVNGCTTLHGLLCQNNLLTTLSLERISELWELHCEKNGLKGELDLSSHQELKRISCEENPQLLTIHVRKGFNPNDTYFLGGVGTMPCYTKDASAQWLVKQ